MTTSLHNKQLAAMLQMQDNINQRIHSAWRDQQHPWYRAIWVECAELMDHQGWKWWKKQTPNMEQIQLELVDIWHFGLSDLLQRDPLITEKEKLDALSLTPNSPHSYSDFLTGIEHFANLTLQTKQFSAPHFFGLCQQTNLTFEALYQLYISKNVLNLFRQDHGYQSGEYQKNWSGKEDNEHLSEIVALHQNTEGDWQKIIYAELQTRYETQCSA